MRMLSRVGVAIALIGVAALASMSSSSPAGANPPVEIKVSADNTDGSQGCTKCKLDLKVGGTAIDAAGTGVSDGVGDLVGPANVEINSVKTTATINESRIVVGTFPDGVTPFVMIQLRDTTLSGAGIPNTVQIRLMPGAPIVRVRDSTGALLAEFSPGEYDLEIKSL